MKKKKTPRERCPSPTHLPSYHGIQVIDMEIKRRYIIMRIDGVPVNLKYEPVKSLSSAARFGDLDEYNAFITGFYKPIDASQYKPQEIEIIYREVTEDVQQE